MNWHTSSYRLRVPLAVPILLLYALVGVLLEPQFLGPTNVESMLVSAAVLLPAVMGMQLLLVLGRFDLSTGSTASLAAMLTALAVLRFPQYSGLAIPFGVLVGAAIGMLVGVLVSRLRIDPLIATLAMMGIGRSIALICNDGRIVAGLPVAFGWVGGVKVGGIPFVIVFSMILALSMAVLSRHTVILRRFYAAGSNPVGAQNAGIDVQRLVAAGYVLAGMGAATTGVLLASRTRSASPLAFQDLAVEAIGACIVGGSKLAGGSGGVLGAVAGLIVVTATGNLVSIIGVSVFWREFAVGALLLVAVLGNSASTKISEGLKRKNEEST